MATTYDGETAEQKILEAWNQRFQQLLGSLDFESRLEAVNKKLSEEEAKLKTDEDNYWLAFPGWWGFKPTEVLIFQPSLTGLSFAATGLKMSITGISLGYTIYKVRNGVLGFEPCICDNSNYLETTRLGANRATAALVDDNDILSDQKAGLEEMKNALSVLEAMTLHNRN